MYIDDVQYLYTSYKSRHCTQTSQSNTIYWSRYWCNAGTTSATLAQYYASIGSTYRAWWTHDQLEIPRKHVTLKQCCFNVGSASETLGQRENNIVSVYRVCWIIAFWHKLFYGKRTAYIIVITSSPKVGPDCRPYLIPSDICELSAVGLDVINFTQLMLNLYSHTKWLVSMVSEISQSYIFLNKCHMQNVNIVQNLWLSCNLDWIIWQKKPIKILILPLFTVITSAEKLFPWSKNKLNDNK